MTRGAQSFKNRSVVILKSTNRFPGDLVQQMWAISPAGRGSAMNEKTIGPGRPGQRGKPVVTDRKFAGQLVDDRQFFAGLKATHDVADVIRSGRPGIFGNRSGVATRKA